MSEDKKELFCVRCFASESAGSMGGTISPTDKQGALCGNCGAINAAVPLSPKAIESIREQASWVGKRFYPHGEDIDARAERKRLLKQVMTYAGRTAVLAPEHVHKDVTWFVSQRIGPNASVSVYVQADTAFTAMATDRLPFFDIDTVASWEKP
jgi:hypothetical protein